MIDNRQIETACVFHRSTHHRRRRHRTAVIRDSNDAGILHLAHLRQLFAAASFCNSADGKDVCELR
jgi:hypothetical protein